MPVKHSYRQAVALTVEQRKRVLVSLSCALSANLRHYQYGHYAELGPDHTSPCQTPLHSAAPDSCVLDERMTLTKNRTIKYGFFFFLSTAF